MSELLWIAVPGGKVDNDQVLMLRVVVVPRLDPGSPADQGLADWPPPALAAGTVDVELATAPDATPDVHPVTPSLAVQPGLWAAFFGDLEVRAPTTPPERDLHVTPTSQHAVDVENAYKAAAAALPDAHSEDTFHTAVREQLATFADAEPPPVPRAPMPAPRREPPDFHQVVSMLREHPTVLRALGLVFDLTLPPAALPAGTTGVVRVRWPGAPAGLPPVASPWSAYTRASFLPAPGEGSDLLAGMVALGRPVWQLHTLDVDSARGRLQDAARANGSGPPTLPSLRTAGVLLVRADRAEHLGRRRDAGRANAALPVEELPPLAAGDLTLGYRIDVKVFGQDWHTLVARRATYDVGDHRIADGIPEEGHLKTRAAVDHGDGVLRTDEVVARWDGWSLAAPRPSLDGSRPANDLPFDFHWTLTPEPGSLLKPRFGVTYLLRARVADLAGGGRQLSEPSPDGCDSSQVRFVRHEPVAAPAVALPDGVRERDLGPGGQVDLLVLRSGDGADEQQPADLARLLTPPRTNREVVERHGALDGDPDATFPLIDASGGPLVDPVAKGVAVFLRPEPGGPPADIEPKDWVEPWPGFVAKTLTLRARGDDDPTVDWANPHDLVVCLGEAEQVRLELSSFIDGKKLAEFALGGWLPRAPGGDDATDDAVDAVVSGRHPMITPARTVTLVHAVRKPMAKPAGTFDAARSEGEAFVTLTPRPTRLEVHTNSTAALQVSGAWDEIDDAGEPHPVTGAPVDTVAVARGDTQLRALRHELGDTKHRRITYTLTAASRFRSFFTGGTDADFQNVGTSDEVVVLSSARPVPPVVRSVVPAFTWEETSAGGVVTRRRLGGRVRVELARPWFTTGAGEALALVGPVDDQPPPELWPYLTQRGRDPLWDTGVPSRWPTPGGDRVRLAETGAEVMAVPHPVWAFGESRYADVQLPPDESYCPLAQLAVARYQPNSLGGLELSPVVRTDYVPLLPDRTLTVDFSVDGEATVRLDGLGPAGPLANVVEVSVELCSVDSPTATELVARPEVVDAPTAPAWESMGLAVATVLGSPVTVAILPDRPLRVRVREVEQIGVAPGVARGPTELHDRVVFTDVVAVPG